MSVKVKDINGGQAPRRRLKSQGLSIREIARRLGIFKSKSTVSRLLKTVKIAKL